MIATRLTPPFRTRAAVEMALPDSEPVPAEWCHRRSA